MSYTDALVSYIAGAAHQPLSPDVKRSATHHVLDTIAACVSGRSLAPGKAGASYVSGVGTDGPAVVIGTDVTTTSILAAFANAMAAHADESDDTHELSKSHPGCSIVPSALAVADDLGCDGPRFLRAVTLGYDIGCRVNMALWPSFAEVRKQPRGTPGISGMFGSAAAAASLSGLGEARVRFLLSYVAQQVSGMNTWKRDTDHLEKAHALGGWPSFGALFALSLVQSGWTGVDDVFTGDPNFLQIVAAKPDPKRLVDGLGERFEIERTHIKLFSVGSPAQAPVQGLTEIIEGQSLTADQIRSVRVTIPAVLAHTVQRTREMPNINLHYLLSAVVDDGHLSFDATHDIARFMSWRRSGGDRRIEVVSDETWAPRRQALVEVVTIAGVRFSHRVERVRGSDDNPLTENEVRKKALGLITPHLGERRAEQICDVTLGLDELEDVRELTGLLGATR